MSKIVISDGVYKVVKIVLMVVGLYIAYLFALNGRYVVGGTDMDDLVFDNWKHECFPMREVWFNEENVESLK